jgi:hypothetical protein
MPELEEGTQLDLPPAIQVISVFGLGREVCMLAGAMANRSIPCAPK